MGVVGATIAGLAAANAIAGTVKNVTGALKEVGEVINNSYEGVKKVIKDMNNKKDSGNARNNRRQKRGRRDGSEN